MKNAGERPRRQILGLLHALNQKRQWLVAVASLHVIDQVHRAQVERIGSKTVKGIRGHAHDQTRLDAVGDVRHHAHVRRLRIDLHNFRSQILTPRPSWVGSAPRTPRQTVKNKPVSIQSLESLTSRWSGFRKTYHEHGDTEDRAIWRSGDRVIGKQKAVPMAR